MISLFRRLQDWDRSRIERNYSQIISEYSPEEQERIQRGRKTIVTALNKSQFEESIGYRIANIPNCQLTSKAGYMTYDRQGIFGRDYRGDVECWLKLGNLGVDALIDSFFVGPDAFQSLVGKPAIILKHKKD